MKVVQLLSRGQKHNFIKSIFMIVLSPIHVISHFCAKQHAVYNMTLYQVGGNITKEGQAQLNFEKNSLRLYLGMTNFIPTVETTIRHLILLLWPQDMMM